METVDAVTKAILIPILQAGQRLEDLVLAPLGEVWCANVLRPIDNGIHFVFPAYHAFLNRKAPEVLTMGGDSMGNWYYIYTLAWTVFFTIVCLLIPVVSRRYFPVWWNGMRVINKGKDGRDKVIDYRRDFPSYVVCLMHHMYVVPRAWYRIYQDYHLPASQWAKMDYGPLDFAEFAPILLGYLISDLICYALPLLSVEYIFHHFFTISITAGGYKTPSINARYIPHLLTVDTSQLFFNAAWLIRRFGVTDSNPIVIALELLFVVSFPTVRILTMPMAFITATLNGQIKSFGWVRWVILPLCLMQYYWFFLIIRRLMRMLTPAKKSKAHRE